MVGWRISQLNSVYVDPGEILKLFRDPPGGNITEVYNSKLAQAHISAENRLTVSEVIQLCGDSPIAEDDSESCYLGADIGNLIHCVVGKKHPDKGAQIVYVGAFPDWEYLDSLMRRFNIARAVIDALPETRNAREFSNRHNGRVFICYYQEHQKGSYNWNEKEMTVLANRTEALDASHTELVQGKIILPRESEIMHEFARQCANVARVLQTEPDTGSSRYVYMKTGEDHYRHAQSYECMARQNSPDYLFPNL